MLRHIWHILSHAIKCTAALNTFIELHIFSPSLVTSIHFWRLWSFASNSFENSHSDCLICFKGPGTFSDLNVSAKSSVFFSHICIQGYWYRPSSKYVWTKWPAHKSVLNSHLDVVKLCRHSALTDPHLRVQGWCRMSTHLELTSDKKLQQHQIPVLLS